MCMLAWPSTMHANTRGGKKKSLFTTSYLKLFNQPHSPSISTKEHSVACLISASSEISVKQAKLCGRLIYEI